MFALPGPVSHAAPDTSALPAQWTRSDVRSGFATTEDGEHLYWRRVGPTDRRPPARRRKAMPHKPAFVCCNGVGVSTFFYKYIVEHFRNDRAVLVWDYRGHGRSSVPKDIDATDLSIERSAADLQLVLDAAGIEGPVVLLGHSMGCQVILEYHKQHPDRVAALIPMFGTFGRPLDTFLDFKHSATLFGQLRSLAARTDRTSRRWLLPLYASPLAFDFSRATGLVHAWFAPRTDIQRYTDHLGHMDPDVFLGMVARMADHDLAEHLPTIRCPTLVFGADRDMFTPAHRSTRMAELIPDAELMLLTEASHAAIVEHPETIALRIERFLHERLREALAR